MGFDTERDQSRQFACPRMRYSPKAGSSSCLRHSGRLISGCGSVLGEDATTYESKPGPAVHLPLDRFEPIDVPLDGTLTPFVSQGCFDGAVVPAQPLHNPN